MATKEEIIWKTHKSGLFKISNSGSIFVFSRSWLSGRWIVRKTKERFLSFNIDKKGYFVFTMRISGVLKNFKVHRLVAEYFIPNPENKPQVNHKDGNKQNNNVSNLEWVTGKENMAHAKINNLMNAPKGEKHGKAKLTTSQVLEIRSSNLPEKELAIKYNVNRSAINAIKNKTKWKHV